MRPAGHGNISNCITSVIAEMRRCLTAWCCARAATEPRILVAAMRAQAGKSDVASRASEVAGN